MTPQETRRRLIVTIVREETIHNQEELQTRLAERGISVTQATLSRDLRALRITRVPHPREGTRYVSPSGDRPRGIPFVRDDIARAIERVRFSGNLAVIKTKLSYAEPVGLSIDQLDIPEVIGTVSGEDTVLVVLVEHADRRAFLEAIGSPAGASPECLPHAGGTRPGDTDREEREPHDPSS